MSVVDSVQNGVPTNRVAEVVGIAVLDPRVEKITVEPEGGGSWRITVVIQ